MAVGEKTIVAKKTENEKKEREEEERRGRASIAELDINTLIQKQLD